MSIGRAQTLGILDEHFAHAALEQLFRGVVKILWADHAILRIADGVANGRRCNLLRVDAEVTHDGFHQCLRIFGIVNTEVPMKAETLGIAAQQTREGGVKRAHPEAAGFVAGHHLLDALAHFAGCLVGEGERENVGGRHAALQQIGNAIGEHAGLATSGTGHNHDRTFDGFHRGFLLGIQPT